MKKRLISFLLVLVLSFSLSLPTFAVDDMEYYSFPPVGGSEPSVALDWPVNPAEFSNGDSRVLANIWSYIQYFTFSPSSWGSNSLFGFLEKIYNRIPSNLADNFGLQGLNRGTNAMLDEIAKWTMFSYNSLTSDNIAGNLGKIQQNTLATASRILDSNSLLGSINNAVSGINGYATESTLNSFLTRFNQNFGLDSYKSPTRQGLYQYFLGWTSENGSVYGSWGRLMEEVIRYFGRDDITLYNTRTLYGIVAQMQDVLASDEDKALSDSQKENREQIEQDFVSGSSGKTSLGKGDFSNASQVGGALNDTFNMGGASKVSDFLFGFGSAGSESQAWFSQTTANNLNAVESGDGTQGVSTFADDGVTMVDVDPDPYNMASIFERYDWLEGVSIDG